MSAERRSREKLVRSAEAQVAAYHDEKQLGAVSDFRLLFRLTPFIKPHASFLGLAAAALVLVAGLRLVRPLLMGDVVRRATDGDADGLLVDGLLLALVMVVAQALTFAQMYATQVAGARAMADLRAHIFAFFQRLELRYFDRTPVGRLVTRATNDVDAVGELFASGVVSGLGDLIALVGIVVMMVSLDVRLSLVAFASLPVVGLIVGFVRKRSRAAFRDIRVRTARLNAFLNEQVHGIAVVQAFGREEVMAEQFDAINAAYRDANKRSIFYDAVLDAAIEMVATLCIASMLWWAARQMGSENPVTFATVVTFAEYIRQFFEPVSMLSQRYTLLQSAMAGAERIFQLLDETDLEVETAAGDASPADIDDDRHPAFELDHVTFGYKPGVPVLHDVVLTVDRGERVAVVGTTGAGKSTVASLLLRLYDVHDGVVRVSGTDVRAIERPVLRERFAVVPQEVVLFPGTIAENVALSDKVPDQARVKHALEVVGALEVFERRAGGLDARVDDRGANFSAGERQLIAFARAVYKDAPILILDEATASVDSDTESRLQRAVDALLRDRTALIIAHRLSTVQSADRIVVFHGGRIVEEGHHASLMRKGGFYARLHALQHAQDEVESMQNLPVKSEGSVESRDSGERPV